MQNDVMWRKLIRAWQRNKPFWSQNENSLLQVQKFNSRRLNQLWKAFLSSVVEAETFHCLWRKNLKVHILCNSAIDFFWVVKLPRVPDAQWIVRFFLVNTVQWHDFKGVQLVVISVSFCDLDAGLNTQDLVKLSCGGICFKIFSRWRDWYRLRKTFVHLLFCAVWHILAMFIHSDRVELFCCLVWNYQKPGNIYLLEMALNLLLCGFRLFMFYWTRYHTDLEQMLKKNHQNIRQYGHWKLQTSLKVGLRPEGAHNRHSETVIN